MKNTLNTIFWLKKKDCLSTRSSKLFRFEKCGEMGFD